MADTKGFTKEKSRAVTSRTNPSRQPLNVKQSMTDGEKLPMDARDAEKMRDLLARIIDVTHNWPCKLPSGKMPLPLISNGHIIIAFPFRGHVIKNTVTSEGKQNFSVDGEDVIPVTSSGKVE